MDTCGYFTGTHLNHRFFDSLNFGFGVLVNALNLIVKLK